MDRDSKNKILYWFIDKKMKGYSIFDFNECMLDVGLEPQIYSNINMIDKQFRLYEKMINDVILFYEENN